MSWLGSQSERGRDMSRIPEEREPVPVRRRYPNLGTYDPYLVSIVRMLEELRKETKN